MLKRFCSIALTLLLLFALCSCGAQDKSYTYTETTVSYTSRGVEVPAVVTIPDGAENMPLVVICHGHGGDRNENVGFPAIAAALAEKGIASIRMDFPGCGESTEQFTENILSNMKQDVLSALSYVTSAYDINTDKIGIYGYSMGGRITLELLAESSYNFAAVGLLAPAADTEDLKNLFGGAENWEVLKAAAVSSEEQYVLFTTIYGQEQHLSARWFEDLEKYSGDSLIPAAAAAFDGPSLVIYAVDDEAVSPSVSQKVAEALNSEVVTVPEDGHSYGFYSDKIEILNTVVNSTADFFAEQLK